MMRLAIERGFAADHVEAIGVDPMVGNASARQFFERLRFRIIEDRRFGEDDAAV